MSGTRGQGGSHSEGSRAASRQGARGVGETTARLLLLALNLLAHCLALLLFLKGFDAQTMPLRWRPQFGILLAFSAAASVARSTLAARRTGLAVVFVALRVGLLVVMGAPEGTRLDVEMVLVTALVVDSGVGTVFPVNVVLCAFVVASGVFSQHRADVWGMLLERPSAPDMAVLAFYPAVLAAVCCTLRYQIDRRVSQSEHNERLLDATLKLAESNMELQRYAALVEEHAKASERKRVGRDIHDSIGYTLTNVIMMMEAATDVAESRPEELRELIRSSRQQAAEGLREVRRALRELRSVEVPRSLGLAVVQRMAQAFARSTGIEVAVEFGNVPWSFGETIDDIVYRFVQEGMTNALRHGRATAVNVYFWQDAESLNLVVRDDGCGCDDVREGIGIAGMRERLEQVGGHLTFRSVVGGFEIAASVPCAAPERGHAENQVAAG